jgi:outer membrane immunogenic protein
MRGIFLIGGMMFAASAANPSFAADMPIKSPTPAALPSWTWSGFYLGIAGGWAFGNTNQIAGGPLGFGPITPGYKVKGGLAGETVGYNWQMQNWVVGVEGDMSWANVRAFTHESSPPFGGGIVQTNENWLATGRARLGWTVTNSVMVFATGGIAAAAVEANILPLAAAERTETHVRWGGIFGGGIESKITANWSVKAEYLYVNFASQSYYDNPPPGTNTRSNVPLDNNIFRVGFNYALQ